VIEKIFEPFFTTKEPGVGTGMGLAQVHGIVKSHGGRIRVEKNVPHGARFVITLPVVRTRPDEDVTEVTLPSGTESILVVDGDEIVAGVTSRILTDLGYSVHICQESLQALTLVTASPERFDLVITEVDMAVMTGDHLARALFSVRPDLPIVLCAGLHGTVDEVEASTQLRTFLEKPVSKGRLAETVRNILDESSLAESSVVAEECQAD
jgi:CheY-like chemotaxis protein